jgi:hypothetical protein
MCAISSARRLSKDATRNPANDDESTGKAAPFQLIVNIELEIWKYLTHFDPI